MHSQSNSTRDCFQILLAFSNQFYIIGYVDGTTISSLAPNSTCPRWLGMPRRNVYTRRSRGDARRDTRHRRASQFIRRSYVKEKIKCCTNTSFAAAFASARRVVTFLALLTFVLVRCRSTFGSGRWSVGILLPITPRPSLFLPTTTRIGVPRLFSLIPS